MPSAPSTELATEQPYGDPNNPNVDPDFPIQGGAENLNSADRPAPTRGILKNPLRSPNDAKDREHLSWDEANIALTEIQKDSLMKIDEPKTPFVRYDAVNDVVLGIGDVPDLDLEVDPLDASRPAPPSSASSSQGGPHSPTRSMTRDNTEVNARRPSISSSSSRSASFSLPDHAYPVRPGESSHTHDVETIPAALGATYANTSGNAQRSNSVSGASEVFADSDDEKLDDEARAHKRDFEKKRAMHYGQEAALALKKSREMAEEEEVDDEQDDGVPPPVPNMPNGVNGSRGSSLRIRNAASLS
ncbi:hypothetical protein CcaverHIS002_0109460 [Cutaneotrichosporon cavernicola]|uniref:Protein phosphatase inhibitor 2 (IPP-2) n=1 Tax=Cutaneotrichosporon cavernicola TaxID=279322 RepID=A0AA48KXF2_9TREE|nr:uncharacterized protein CcaverHIS019_0109370 [Cutaneotrichosporon cavernicola]BEI80417.1 hypothetical protein CcaverHIS002_0109460 [Cutaneotrichosporon cavernicola]BEI88219.1 hypothetical protein CcaverHIS019_0109370 [Cutaneotrichosporon cavernicola]BEI95990.1 hypothetical protein CcaverHIS631_0109390 [Cutaneotrichosporon cavernicola]